MNNQGVEGSSESGKSKCWKILFLKKWHPQPTVQGTKYLFLCVGIVFIVFGVIINIFNAKIKEKEISHYEEECKNVPKGSTCTVPFTLTEEYDDTIYLFYGLENFYQNHRRYIKSKSSSQLSGTDISTKDAETYCSPIVKVKDLAPEQRKHYEKKTPLNDNDLAIPCGLIARSFFTDKYKLYKIDDNGNKGAEVTIDETGIAWPDDKGNKFKMNQDLKDKYWQDVEDEHFIVWMRTSGLPNFRKLWGVIRQKLSKGDYKFEVENNYSVVDFKGHKNIILSTSGPFGGKNYFLSISFIVVGSISVLIALAFYIKQRTTDNRFGNSRHQD